MPRSGVPDQQLGTLVVAAHGGQPRLRHGCQAWAHRRSLRPTTAVPRSATRRRSGSRCGSRGWRGWSSASGKQAEGTSLASDVQMSLAHRVPVHVVPQVGGRRRRDPARCGRPRPSCRSSLPNACTARCSSGADAAYPSVYSTAIPVEQHIGLAGTSGAGAPPRRPRHLAHGRAQGRRPGARRTPRRTARPGRSPGPTFPSSGSNRRAAASSIGTASSREVELYGDLRAQQVYPRPPGFVQRSRLGGREERQRLLERAGGRLGLRGLDRASCPPSPVGRERGRRLQTGGCCREPAVRERAVSRHVELCRDRFVRAHRRTGAVPGAPVRIDVRVGDVGEGLVDLPPFRRCRRAVDRRADERMPEPDPVAQLDQPGRLGGGRRIGTDAQPLRRAPQQRRRPTGSAAAASSSCRAGRGQARSWRDEPPLEAVDQGPGVARPGAPEGQLGRRQALAAAPGGRAGCRGTRPATRSRTRGSSGQGTADSSSAAASPLPSPRTTSSGSPASRGSRRSRVRRRPWPPVPRRVGGPRTPASAPRPGPATARRPPRRSVAAPRPPGRAGSALPGPAGTDPEAAPLQAECRAECVPLRGRQPRRPGPGKDCTAGAGRRTRAPSPTRRPPRGHPASRGAVDEELEQGRLADAGLAAQHQNLAAARLRGRYQAAQGVALVLSSPQPRPEPPLDMPHRLGMSVSQSCTGTRARQRLPGARRPARARAADQGLSLGRLEGRPRKAAAAGVDRRRLLEPKGPDRGHEARGPRRARVRHGTGQAVLRGARVAA